MPNDSVDGTEMTVVLAEESLVHRMVELNAKFGFTSSCRDIDGFNTTSDEDVIGVRRDVGIVDGALISVGGKSLQGFGFEKFGSSVFASSCESEVFGVEADSATFVVVREGGSNVLLSLNVHEADSTIFRAVVDGVVCGTPKSAVDLLATSDGNTWSDGFDIFSTEFRGEVVEVNGSFLTHLLVSDLH
jgi:hypothetical protein